MQAFIAADIRASRLVFITTAVVPGMLTIPGRSFYCPGSGGYPFVNGYPDARVPLTGLVSVLVLGFFIHLSAVLSGFSLVLDPRGIMGSLGWKVKSAC